MGKHEYMCIRKHLPDCDQSYIKRHLKRDFSRSWGYFKLGLGGDVHREGGVRNGILCEWCLEHRRYSDTAETQRSQQWEAGVTLQGASRLEEGDKNWWTLERGSDGGRSAQRGWWALGGNRNYSRKWYCREPFAYFRAWEVLELHLFPCISTSEINC